MSSRRLVQANDLINDLGRCLNSGYGMEAHHFTAALLRGKVFGVMDVVHGVYAIATEL